jgi:hypothetical protein
MEADRIASFTQCRAVFKYEDGETKQSTQGPCSKVLRTIESTTIPLESIRSFHLFLSNAYETKKISVEGLPLSEEQANEMLGIMKAFRDKEAPPPPKEKEVVSSQKETKKA